MKWLTISSWVVFLCLALGASHTPATAGTPFELQTVLGRGRAEFVDWNDDGSMIAIGGSAGVLIYTATLEDYRRLDLGQITALAWQPHGNLLAVAHNDKTVEIWDGERLTLHSTLAGAAAPMHAIEWSPDGTYLAAGSDNGTVRIWEFASGGLEHVLEGHTGGVRRIRWNADGTRLAIANWGTSESVFFLDDETALLRIWDATTGQFLFTIETEHAATSFDWHPSDSSILAVTVKFVQLWDVREQRLLTEAFLGPGPLDVAWSPDGTRLAIQSQWAIYIADQATWQNIVELPKEDYGNIAAFDWNADGTKIIGVNYPNPIYLWNTLSGEVLMIADVQNYSFNSLIWHPTEDQLISAGRTIDVWDVHRGERVDSYSPEVEPPFGRNDFQNIAWNPTYTQISFTYYKALEFWDLPTDTFENRSSLQHDRVACMAWHPDGRLLATGEAGGWVVIWNAQTREPSSHFDTGSAVHAIDWSPDGQVLATGDTVGNIDLWDATTLDHLQTLHGHTRSVTDLAFSSDGTKLASASAAIDSIVSDSASMRVWDVAQGDEIIAFEGMTDNVFAIAWNADNTRISSGGGDPYRRVWDRVSGSWIITETPPLMPDYSVRVWDAATGTLVATLTGHSDLVTDVDWSPDGMFLASSSLDGTIRVWRDITP